MLHALVSCTSGPTLVTLSCLYSPFAAPPTSFDSTVDDPFFSQQQSGPSVPLDHPPQGNFNHVVIHFYMQ